VARTSEDLDQLRLLVDAVGDYAIFLLDPAGHIRSWNTGARRIKGWSADEIIGRHFSTFYTPEDLERDHPAHELEIAAREGRYEEEGWRVRKDGSRFWANIVITALRDANGTLIGFGKVTRDLTARRLAEEQLRLNAAELRTANADLEQFRLLVSGVRDYAIFLLDPGGHIRTWNDGAAHLNGYSEPEVIGRHFSIFYTDEDKQRDHPAHELEIAARVGRYEEEGWRVRKDGTRFWAGVLITALRDDHGILAGFGKVTRDLSERRATQLRLEQMNLELERFAYAAAHDLSEPLHTIVGLSDVLDRRHGEELGEGREYLDHIRAGALRLRERVDALLAYARASQQQVEQEPIALGAAVDEVVHGLGARIAEREARVEYDAAALPTVRADARLLEVVLQNLIGNALKFGRPQQPHIAITADPAEAFWRVCVIDDGPGIDPAEHERIFEPFQRGRAATGAPGAGLGLALARRIIERHGGDMGVDAQRGEGSCFWFTLPAAS
jgi:PAS domain S-box-containing protein